MYDVVYCSAPTVDDFPPEFRGAYGAEVLAVLSAEYRAGRLTYYKLRYRGWRVTTVATAEDLSLSSWILMRYPSLRQHYVGVYQKDGGDQNS